MTTAVGEFSICTALIMSRLAVRSPTPSGYEMPDRFSIPVSDYGANSMM